MKNFHLRIAAIVLFSSFAATSRSFSATHEDTVFLKNAADQIDVASEMKLPLFSSTATNSMPDMTEPALQSAEMVDSFPGMYIIDPDEPNSAALNWLENELQMSIDPSSEPQRFSPDFSCIKPPYNCPANVVPDFLPGAVCVVTSCGVGACPTCPSIIPGLVIKAWCAYGCMQGSKVVGGCYGFWSRVGNRWLGPFCFPG